MICKRYRVALPAVAVAAALVVAGCGSSGSSTKKIASKPAMPKSEGGAMMSAHTGAQVSVREPGAGTVVAANTLPTTVDISHFRVDCRFAGTANKMGVGHYHIELDGSLINMFCKPGATVSMLDVKPGRHQLSFIPAENDHTDDMKAAQKASFVYKPSNPLPVPKPESRGKPSIRILSPQPGTTIHRGFDLTVAPKNFEFSCALYGKPDIAGYGHWHANVDSTSKGMMGMATMLGMSCQRTFHVSLAGISRGPHTFYAILEDNQHAPTPKAQDSVRLNVR